MISQNPRQIEVKPRLNSLGTCVVWLSRLTVLINFLLIDEICFDCRLEENGVLTDCSIKTQEPDETLDFNFSNTNVVNKIIMKV